jgi:hypothetical protein
VDIAHRLSRSRYAQGWTSDNEVRRRLTGLLFLLLSIGLGAWAYDEAKSDALRSWEKSHPPSAKVWEHALGSKALTVPGKKSRVSQAARSLPARLEEEGTAWISGDKNWVAVFNAPEADPPYRLFCRNCDLAPPSWDPAGHGWRAFERILSELDTAVTSSPVRKRISEPSDPREIRY